MFTIKYIDPRNNEFAVECVSYYAETIPAAVRNGEVGIKITAYGTPYREEISNFWAGTRSVRRPGTSELHVMNRFGATIASYYFIPPEMTAEPQAEVPNTASASAEAA